MTLKNVLVVALTWSLASFAMAGGIEKFEAFLDGDLVGQGDWGTSHLFGSSSGYPSGQIGDVGLGLTKGVGDETNSPNTFSGGSIALDPADVPADGTFTLRADVFGGASQNPTIGLGTNSLADNANSERSIFLQIKPTKAEVTSRDAGGTLHREVQDPVAFQSLGWVHFRLNAHLTGGQVTSADYQYVDIDDNSGAAIGSLSSPFAFDFSGQNPFALTHAFLMTGNYGSGPHGRVDNFGPIPLIPEPASLALLGLGGLTMLRRRR